MNAMLRKRNTINYLLKPLSKFIESESVAGVLLFVATLVALIWANSVFSDYYYKFWHLELSIGFAGYAIAKSLHSWMDDGLMAMFFFVVGLELKRELIIGELSSPRNAILPLAAAIGGIVVPALLYWSFNAGSPGSSGWGIPMATDIAFALGVLSLLGKRVPLSLKIFLTVLAVADDLSAVLVIAFFYTSNISMMSLGIGAFFLAVLIAANYIGIRNTLFYGVVGIGGLWLAFLLSGVHASIAGVLAAFAIPAKTKINERSFSQRLVDYLEEFLRIEPNDAPLLKEEQVHVIGKIRQLTLAADTPLQRLEQGMHPLVSYIVLPLFALANAGITLDLNSLSQSFSPVSMGVGFGLLAGKFIGVVGACFLVVQIGWAKLPSDIGWGHLCGLGFLAGVGFTMSLFITNLAFDSEQLIMQAKLGILSGSFLAGLIGYLLLNKILPLAKEPVESA